MLCSCFKGRAEALKKLEEGLDDDLDSHTHSSSLLADATEWFYFTMTTPTFRYQILRMQTRSMLLISSSLTSNVSWQLVARK